MGSRLDILLIEDNVSLSQNVAEFLEGRGHRLDFAFDGPSGLRQALAGGHDVIVLDLALPRLDGLDLCRALRARSDRHVPVIMITARDTLDDKLRGFDGGADDYLTKPFALAELAVRCETLARRHRHGASHVLTVGSLTIDRRLGEARREGQLLRLTPQTWQVLLALAEAFPALVPRHELTRRLWGDEPPDSDSLRSHIHLLRQALDKPFATPMLETLHGVGFRLRADR
jgi:DNA-binding response OmpR family regulator